MRVHKHLSSVGVSAVLAVLLVVPPASAAPTTAIPTLQATAGATGIAVAGKAVFANGSTLVAPDTSDGLQHGKVPGSDLRGGTIALSDNNRELIFTLDVANMDPNRLPNVFYTWPLTVDGVVNNYFLLAGPAGLAQSSTVSTEPFFDLKSIGANGFTQVASLTGTMGNGKVTWNVPLGTIGAKFGSVITQGTTASNRPGVGTGVAGALQTYATLDIVDRVDEYVVPGTVLVGIGTASTPDEFVATTTPATIRTSGTQTGTFSATLPTPAQPGEYKIVARACSTEDDCVVRSVPLTL